MPKYQIVEVAGAQIPSLREKTIETAITHVQVGGGPLTPVVRPLKEQQQKVDGHVLHEFEATDYWAAHYVWKEWVKENIPGLKNIRWIPLVPSGTMEAIVYTMAPDGEPWTNEKLSRAEVTETGGLRLRNVESKQP